jgi:hypothetical protein
MLCIVAAPICTLRLKKIPYNATNQQSLQPLLLSEKRC